ncbi:MAG: ABC transporter ATP-binding protein [Gemmatimonadota bacterium]|nr:MAG: ABC transporter ATP-binding protein [Gemmatimonadota bacterium]
MKIYRRLFSYVTPSWKSLTGSILCTVCFTLFSGLLVLLVGPFLKTVFSPQGFIVQDDISVRGDDQEPVHPLSFLSGVSSKMKSMAARLMMGETRVESLRRLCLLVIVVSLLKSIFLYLQGYLMAYVEQRLIMGLRNDLYRHFHTLSLSYFHGERTGQLISRVTYDVSLVNSGVTGGFVGMIKDPLLIFCYTVILFYFSWRLTLFAAIIFPITFWIMSKFGKRIRRQSTVTQEKMADITSLLQETISGIRVVKAFAMERFEIDKFTKKIREYFKTMLRLTRIRKLFGPVNEAVITIVCVLILWYGGRQVLTGGALEPEYFIAFLVVLFSIIQPVKDLVRSYGNVQIGIAAAKRIFQVMDIQPKIREAPKTIDLPKFQDSIRFEDVSFSYNGSDMVLEHINLEVRRSEITALAGPSGGGKSTLMDLLARFYDPTEGRIEIDGIDVRMVRIDDLRRLMGIVTQETVLFNDTVRNNIAYGIKGISDDRIIQAAKAANAHAFIDILPQKYETTIGDRGVRISGGERQRLAIARAILKDPDILIFDEATSALDTESEFLVQQAIENLMENRTVFVIAHRLSTIRHADRIIVIDNGRIVQQGRHEELLEQGGLYKKLYDMQFRDL